MSFIKNPLIVALDVDTVDEAVSLAGALAPSTGAFKVGMQLFNSAGPEAVRRLIEKNAPVFVDLKLHDIPNTVAGAARALTRHGAAIFNVHAAGGRVMMQEAARAARDEAAKAGIKPPLVIAVTVLTSIDEGMF
ncbi:MAG: orotidine-5'-phosphate decarboxylase, partial [Paludibacter sp.]|nr:orotidine-5'-phosphate decarboxylase [Paludibacter sp.]